MVLATAHDSYCRNAKLPISGPLKQSSRKRTSWHSFTSHLWIASGLPQGHCETRRFRSSGSLTCGSGQPKRKRNLIDLRKLGPFKGKGTLLERANEVLRTPWQQGSSADVSAAMAEFRRLYQNDLLEHSPVSKTDQAEFRSWSKRFAQWLFSTDHISIRYGIKYDGIDIRKLSPGTRGIVLLLLYLALDEADDRPARIAPSNYLYSGWT